jgi:acetylornithine/N-succinyldiaminopimelate aminotransferase
MEKTLQAIEKRHLIQTYARLPLVIERGKGCWVWDCQGEKYLDFLSGLSVNALGHSHPRLVRVLREQAGRLIHISNLYYHAYQAPLAAELKRITHMDRVFFCNSGAEGIEGAIKLARSHGKKIRKGKFEIVALENSFHGRTTGALAATGQEKIRKDFEPLLPGVKFVRLNDIRDLKAAINRNTCAVLLEPIQGEGGVYELDREFLQTAATLARENKALLILDEIQCGLGRTGRYLAAQQFGITPDVLVLAKSLAGGLPMGAILTREEVATDLGPGMHGTTFGGGPLTCRVALEFLAVLKEEKILKHVRTIGAYFKQELKQLQSRHPIIREVRGRGLMLALDLDRPSRAIVLRAQEMGLLLNSTHGSVIRFLPPLIVDTKLVDRAIRILEKALREAEK